MDITVLQMILAVAVPVSALGAAWGGGVTALRGTKERVKEIQNIVGDHIRADEALQREMIDRAARIETKLDILMEKK